MGAHTIMNDEWLKKLQSESQAEGLRLRIASIPRFSITDDPDWLKKIEIKPTSEIWGVQVGESFNVRSPAYPNLWALISPDHPLHLQIKGEHERRQSMKPRSEFVELD